MKSSPSLPFVLGGFVALAGCRSEPDVVPLTQQERSSITALRQVDPKGGRVDASDRGMLFTSLDVNLRTWRTLAADPNRVDEQLSFEDVLTKQVYLNFDLILNELEHGTDPQNRNTAAAALGFSKIPAPDEPGGDPAFPALHPRAVQPLVKALEEGSDELAMNALLSLARIESRETPLALLLEMMITHHNEEVRANAALALAHVCNSSDGSMVLPPLFSALSDTSPKVRLHAIKAIGKIGDRSSQGPLVNALRSDVTPLVQACAAAQLGKLGDMTAVPALIEGLSSPTPSVAQSCHRSLIRITGEKELRGYTEWRDWWSESPQNPSRSSGKS